MATFHPVPWIVSQYVSTPASDSRIAYQLAFPPSRPSSATTAHSSVRVTLPASAGTPDIMPFEMSRDIDDGSVLWMVSAGKKYVVKLEESIGWAFLFEDEDKDGERTFVFEKREVEKVWEDYSHLVWR